MRALRFSILALAAVLTATSQPGSNERRLVFDVASVKPAVVPDGVTIQGEMVGVRKGSGVSIPRNTGGPGTDDPGRIHFPLITLKALLTRAWDSYFEIAGPGWLESVVVQVDATMPPDTTMAQYQEMLRNLIIDRFQLKSHVETRQVTGYALAVAKNGLKIKESAKQNGGPLGRPPAATGRGPDGFPIFPASSAPMAMQMRIDPDRNRMLYQQQTMQTLAEALARILKTTVTDETGLTAKYDYTVTYTGATSAAVPADGAEPLPDIFNALQSQLGLKLEPRKVGVEVFAVDHMEKTPAGN